MRRDNFAHICTCIKLQESIHTCMYVHWTTYIALGEDVGCVNTKRVPQQLVQKIETCVCSGVSWIIPIRDPRNLSFFFQICYTENFGLSNPGLICRTKVSSLKFSPKSFSLFTQETWLRNSDSLIGDRVPPMCSKVTIDGLCLHVRRKCRRD